MRIVAVPAEEEQIIHIRGTAFIQREEKTHHGHAGKPFRRPLMEQTVRGDISQGRLVPLYRADGTEAVAEGTVGIFIIDLIVCIPCPDIQIIMEQQN